MDRSIGSQAEDNFTFHAQSVYDAGAASGDDLTTVLDRCIAEIQPGQMLQVICLHPSSRDDVARWSAATGNALLSTEQDAHEILFWIRKGQ